MGEPIRARKTQLSKQQHLLGDAFSIADLNVADAGGAAIRLRDIGEVTRSHREREIITRVNGRESVELEVYKEADANIVAVARAVRNRLFGLPQQRAYVEDQQQKEERAAAAASGSACDPPGLWSP